MHTDMDVTLEMDGRWPIGYPKVNSAGGQVQVALSPRLRLRGDVHDIYEQLSELVERVGDTRPVPA